MNILKEEITNFYGEFKGLQIDPNAILVSLIVSGKTTTIPPKTTTVTTYNMIFSWVTLNIKNLRNSISYHNLSIFSKTSFIILTGLQLVPLYYLCVEEGTPVLFPHPVIVLQNGEVE